MRRSQTAEVISPPAKAWPLTAATVYLPRLQDMSDDEIEGVLVHELSHVMIHPVSGDLKADEPDFNEKVEYATTCIALAVKWAYEAGERERRVGRGAKSVGDKNVIDHVDELQGV